MAGFKGTGFSFQAALSQGYADRCPATKPGKSRIHTTKRGHTFPKNDFSNDKSVIFLFLKQRSFS